MLKGLRLFPFKHCFTNQGLLSQRNFRQMIGESRGRKNEVAVPTSQP